MRIGTFCLVLSLAFNTVVAQNKPATQLFSTPLRVNPAMTGLIGNDMRLALNYFRTYNNVSPQSYHDGNMSFDMPILKGVLPAGDAIGIGASHRFQSAYFNGRTNSTGISAAYHKGIGKDKQHHISLGIQGSFNSAYYTPGTNNIGFEELHGYSYWHTNVGIQYSGFLSRKVSVYGGYALNNLGGAHNRIFLTGDRVEIQPVHALNAGSNIALSRRVSIFGNAAFNIQGSSRELNMGSYARLLLNTPTEKTKKGDIALYLGGWWNGFDQVTPYVGLQAGSSRLGFSMARVLPRSSSYNGFELSYTYVANFRKRKADPQPATTWRCPTMF